MPPQNSPRGYSMRNYAIYLDDSLVTASQRALDLATALSADTNDEDPAIGTSSQQEADDEHVRFLRFAGDRGATREMLADEHINFLNHERIRRELSPVELDRTTIDPGAPVYADSASHATRSRMLQMLPPRSANGSQSASSVGVPHTDQLRVMARGHTRGSADSATRRYYREEMLDELQSGRERTRERGSDQLNSQSADNSLGFQTSSASRTNALLQSARRHARFSPRTRNQVDSYNTEPAGPENPVREDSPLPGYSTPPLPLGRRVDWPAYGQDRTASQRSRRVVELSQAVDTSASLVEEAMKYLEQLRSCATYPERLSSAAASGFLHIDPCTLETKEDLILDTTIIPRPAPSSWLRIGGIFSGHQHASHSSLLGASYTVLQRARTPPTGTAATNTSNSASNRTPSFRPISSIPPRGLNPPPPQPLTDTWPVTVTINTIDYTSMTLSGTMEAYNVPNRKSLPSEAAITTFLEGELIDLNNHTLVTKSFTSDPHIDSTYWRKLAPFSALADDADLVAKLVSVKWLTEELGRKYILMRWKEKCFVTPSDAQSGLTIHGFYYISLRRADGKIEGLYYDPMSSPYQHLEMRPERRMFPSYQFR